MGFDKKVWPFPGNLGLTLHGHSRGAEMTCFFIPELGWSLDAGIEINKHVSNIFLTHGHSDHSAMITHSISRRHQTAIWVPEGLLKYAKNYMIASHQMNDATDTPYPRNYVFLPVQSGQKYEIEGKKKFVMKPVDCLHPVPCVGYCFWERRSKLKEEYRSLPGDQIGKLRKSGVPVSDEVETPMFVFMGDTAAKVFDSNQHLFEFPVVITECTFLEEGQDAESKGHTCWGDLKPHVIAHPATTFVIIHFSMKYSNADILALFQKENLPNVVPWVDAD